MYLEDLIKSEQSDIRATYPKILRKLISVSDCDTIIKELINYKSTVPANNPLNPYPSGRPNFHMQVQVSEPFERHEDLEFAQYPIDFWEQTTLLAVHNFRFGWIYDPFLRELLPIFTRNCKKILSTYKKIMGKDFNHGPGQKPNLYFEVSHYPVGSGFIDKHTHFRNILNGQDKTLVILLTQDGIDHSNAGLIIDVEGTGIDTTKSLNKGDAIIFGMQHPHWVPVVDPGLSGSKQDTGRWVISLFYY
jgi:hypothetical protein